MLAILPLIFAAHLVAAAPPQGGLVARQTNCDTQCAAWNDIKNADEDDSVFCTSQVVGDYVACANCDVAAGLVTQKDAQGIMDTYVSTCKSEGFPVTGATITGKTNSGGRLSTAPVALVALLSVGLFWNLC
ncbi:hypothetical protein B0H17DRAFT_1214716 [Mycena rosella]|uniref:Uncharacterized protein n=1 Tax=Mycena rosella TaxID=1033263 RepID=A0AAD7CMB8_MYCRO|nr:hypothetical protein B0H17DRAFT_1214716 [Mycena rosella]